MDDMDARKILEQMKKNTSKEIEKKNEVEQKSYSTWLRWLLGIKNGFSDMFFTRFQ